ncbi:MAG: bifunctional diaminohydroxyphosphoribosylaminopyrimidine deaminase/5-amino-6-(5-phosphoribosylamino)uracil reductase RibD [Ruminococcus sp.]|nr:bifunctional diaminohydroxyphosphoribosylaminopyrimidine deaminase/5-amino-6-(5-phosphoribosylamino)uracil reductase RibD [Ruminococcus sp.]MDY2855702.1 bifunctional diaminohydroxyphosphoribosylaminopyrimidine deaminase/5-amino-6-(5-phosphoribosylamino)uracil reductase RibD [Oscillospiraceae bacterium]
MSEFTKEDYGYMRRALDLAAKARGFTSPNPMVGAVIVKDGRIIAEGYHQKCGEGHAEVNAFKNATESVEGATMYVTLEPCSHTGKTPPCADKIIEKKIARVVVGAMDPNPLVSGRGVEKLKKAGISVSCGLLSDESVKLNEIFMKYIVNKIPFVVYKSATTLDGKIATCNGESQWITGTESRSQVHMLRHYLSGIMVGINTVLADNPMLNCRTEGCTSPVRIVVDSNLKIPVECNLVQTADKYKTVVATLQSSTGIKASMLKQMGVQVITVAEKDGRVDLNDLMQKLGVMGIDSILLEGGGTLAFSAFSQKIVDKVIYYIAPKIFGGTSAKTSVEGAGFGKIADCVKLKNIETRFVGEDVCITAYVDK